MSSDEVVLIERDIRVAFRHFHETDAWGIPTPAVDIEVLAHDLRASGEVGLPDDSAQGLVSFVAGLEASWTGWEGTRSWSSPYDQLTIAATHAGNRVVLAITFDEGPGFLPDWGVSVTVRIEPGEQLSGLVTDFRRLVAAAPLS